MNVRFADDYGFELNAWEILPLYITTKQGVDLLIDESKSSLRPIIESFVNACIDELIDQKRIGDGVKGWDLYDKEMNEKLSIRLQDGISAVTSLLTEQYGVDHTDMIAKGYVPIMTTNKRESVQNVERCLSLAPLTWEDKSVLDIVYSKLKSIGAIDDDGNGQILDMEMSVKAVDIVCNKGE